MKASTRIIVLLLGVLAACGVDGSTNEGVNPVPAEAGSYTVDSTQTNSATVTVMSAGSVSISPNRAALDQGASASFTATVTGSSNTAVTWRVDGTGNGTVTSEGVYTAPAKAGSFKVIATSAADPTKRATAIVTVAATTGSP